MDRLKNKNIVLTGGAGFLGKQFADAIENEGGTPIILDRDPSKFESCDWHCIQCDLTKESDIKSSLKYIIKEYGKIDGLVNNACNNPKMENKRDYFGRLEDFSVDKFRNDIDVSVVGAFLCIKHFGYNMENNGGGVIVNVGSELGLVGPDQRIYDYDSPKPVSYTVSKSALVGLTKYVSTYWKHVRCNLVAFGGVYNYQPDEFVKRLEKLIPIGRMALKGEYNNTIIYLLSDDSSYMTGSVMVVDGGRTAW